MALLALPGTVTQAPRTFLAANAHLRSGGCALRHCGCSTRSCLASVAPGSPGATALCAPHPDLSAVAPGSYTTACCPDRRWFAGGHLGHDSVCFLQKYAGKGR